MEQRLDCCELLNNNVQGQMKLVDSFNGLSGFVLDYNIQQHSLHADVKWPIGFDTLQYEYHKALYLHFLQPSCTKALHILLKELRNYALRKGKFTLRNFVCLIHASPPLLLNIVIEIAWEQNRISFLNPLSVISVVLSCPIYHMQYFYWVAQDWITCVIYYQDFFFCLLTSEAQSETHQATLLALWRASFDLPGHRVLPTAH